jgi:hypothetical protein
MIYYETIMALAASMRVRGRQSCLAHYMGGAQDTMGRMWVCELNIA